MVCVAVNTRHPSYLSGAQDIVQMAVDASIWSVDVSMLS